MKTVLMISPGYPVEMSYFTRSLAEVGARVIGIGDQRTGDLPADARRAMAHYQEVSSLADTAAVLGHVGRIAGHAQIDQVECLWEPYMVLVAQIREALGLPGLTVAQTLPFRDKEEMKRQLDAAGIRTPHHGSATTAAGIWTAADRIGYPLIVKPIDGAGSADTYQVDSAAELEQILPMLQHVPRVAVEEFIEAEEFTYDTICGGGQVLFDNISLYRPRPLQARSQEWISPATIALRDVDAPELAGGREMGEKVLQALGFTDGFTHMEWYRKDDGEVVFGEIGARPPGARTTDIMNYATDGDVYVGWAEAVTSGRLNHPFQRKYNAATVFKRAQGQGRIVGVTGLEPLLARYGDAVVAVELLPVGAPRRNWRATLLSDGMIIVRHPELSALIEMADRFGTDLQLYAG